MFKHRSIVSPAYQLARTLQFECKIDEDHFEIRIEVFEANDLGSDVESPPYMFQVSRSDFINALPTFSREEELFSFKITHDWAPFIEICHGDHFVYAKTADEVLEKVWTYLRDYLNKCQPS